jgi:hypothetical protein
LRHAASLSLRRKTASPLPSGPDNVNHHHLSFCVILLINDTSIVILIFCQDSLAKVHLSSTVKLQKQMKAENITNEALQRNMGGIKAKSEGVCDQDHRNCVTRSAETGFSFEIQ